jgi:hypothetical protein
MGAAMLLASSSLTLAHAKPFMIVGLDERPMGCRRKAHSRGRRQGSILIHDLANPESPKTVASLPLKNSVVGPPVNVDIDPTGLIALVADSVDVTKDGNTLKQVPDNKIYVIDLKANPPKLAATIAGGKQPSGLNISPSGKMALVANRGDNLVSVRGRRTNWCSAPRSRRTRTTPSQLCSENNINHGEADKRPQSLTCTCRCASRERGR